MGSSARTLVTYVAHVSLIIIITAEFKTHLCVSLQTDLIALPPIFANRVLKRQPLNIYYLKCHLMNSHQQSSSSLPPSLPHQHPHGEHDDQSRPKLSTSEIHWEQQMILYRETLYLSLYYASPMHFLCHIISNLHIAYIYKKKSEKWVRLEESYHSLFKIIDCEISWLH